MNVLNNQSEDITRSAVVVDPAISACRRDKRKNDEEGGRWMESQNLEMPLGSASGCSENPHHFSA